MAAEESVEGRNIITMVTKYPLGTMVLEGGLAAVEGVEEDRFRWLTERERTEGRKGNARVGRNGMKRVEEAR